MRYTALLILLLPFWPCSQTKADIIVSHTEITATTNMTPTGPWPVEAIADGDFSNLNGFVSPDTSGTVELSFTNTYSLTSFVLHNDVNVAFEGIRDFRLDFFDGSQNQISVPFSTQYTGPQNQVAGQPYIFDGVIANVARVDLVILNVHTGVATQTEIREVQFTAIPEPSATALILIGTSFTVLRRRRRGITNKNLTSRSDVGT